MATVQRVKDAEQARRLADRLLAPDRTKPVVVVAVGAGRAEPWVDPQEVADAVGEYADVVRIDTGDATWAFSAAMPPDAQVYGDAGRVYATDLEWVTMPRRSRLRLCFGPVQGAAVTDGLVSDAMQAALAAGLFAARAAQARTVSGTVLGVTAGRALVTGSFGRAVVREELGPADVPLERLVRQGQVVSGLWVEHDGLLDVRPSVRSAGDALAGYEEGDAVLARVLAVAQDLAVLELYPDVQVEVGTAEVTGNPVDDLTDLMTPDEVVVAHVLARDPWRLSLLDVDDDERPRTPPPLLDGGPPWLVEDAGEVPALSMPWVPPQPDPEVESSAGSPAERTSSGEASSVERSLVETTSEQDVAEEEPDDVLRGPSPSDLDPARRTARPLPPPRPSPPVVQDGARATSAPRELHEERAARKMLQEQASALRQENTQLASRLAALEHDVDRLRAELERKRTETRDLRKQAQRTGRGRQARQVFLDPEEQLRHDVYVAWTEIVPAGEKAARPLTQDWEIGPDFLPSLDTVEGISRSKVVEVLVHVLTRLDAAMPGRDLHRLRAGVGGEDPWVERAPGEYCYRVALQLNTPSARRLHYWRSGDRVELSRIVLHDDFRP